MGIVVITVGVAIMVMEDTMVGIIHGVTIMVGAILIMDMVTLTTAMVTLIMEIAITAIIMVILALETILVETIIIVVKPTATTLIACLVT